MLVHLTLSLFSTIENARGHEVVSIIAKMKDRNNIFTRIIEQI